MSSEISETALAEIQNAQGPFRFESDTPTVSAFVGCCLANGRVWAKMRNTRPEQMFSVPPDQRTWTARAVGPVGAKFGRLERQGQLKRLMQLFC